jgi:peptidoglycan-associated lipoprotein
MIKSGKYTLQLMLLLVVVGLVFGCSTADKKPSGAHARAEKGAITPPVTTDPGTGLPEQPNLEGVAIPVLDLPGAREAGLCPRVHFDYDKSEIKSEWIDCLNKVAAFFTAHPEYTLVVEGHCDERGTSEYNIALGERRANTIATHLAKQGLDASRIVTRSWGEERPIATCHEESCWWQNRRGEFLAVQKAR